MDEQDARDAADTSPHPAEQHQAAMDAATRPADTDTQTVSVITRQDILDYAEKRVKQFGDVPPFEVAAGMWHLAAEEYTAGNPDGMIGRLRGDLELEEAKAAEPTERHEGCSGPSHARGDAAKKARKISSLLWCIADEYDGERVWGDQLEARKAERNLNADSWIHDI